MKNRKVINQVNSSTETIKITERDLETKIYRMTGDIMMKMNDKDELIMLLPEIIKALKRQPNDLRNRVQELSDNEVRRDIRAHLIEIFGPKLNKLH
jgi:chaperonin cofactor prefoldin